MATGAEVAKRIRGVMAKIGGVAGIVGLKKRVRLELRVRRTNNCEMNDGGNEEGLL